MTPRVQPVHWERGAILTTGHFRNLETWVESLVGSWGCFSGRCGFARGFLDNDWNTAVGSIRINPSLTEDPANQIVFDVQKLCFVTPQGRLVMVDSLIHSPIAISDASIGRGQPMTVFAAPSPDWSDALERNGASKVPRHIGTGIDLTIAPRSDDDVLPVCRIILSGTSAPTLDDKFVPPSAHLNGCERLAKAMAMLREQYFTAAEKTRRQFPKILESENAGRLEVARRLLATLPSIGSLAGQLDQAPTAFFAFASDALDALRLDADALLPWPDTLTAELEKFLSAQPTQETICDLGPPLRALEALVRRLTGWIDRGFVGEPPMPSAIEPASELLNKDGFGISSVEHGEYKNSFYWKIEIELTSSLREQLGQKQECRVLFKINGSADYCGADVKISTERQSEPTQIKAGGRVSKLETARPPRARNGWYEFSFVPGNADKRRKRIAFYVRDALGKELPPKEKWRENFLVLGSNR